MTDSQALAVWAQVAAHAAAHGQRPSVADVCAVAVSSAQLSGSWVVAARGTDPDFVMCVTDPVSEQLAELQLTLGEGPCHDVLASAGPVLAGDLGDPESARRWPAFTPAACQLGAGAVFAFPLIVGAIHERIPGSDWTIFEESSHMPHVEEEARYLDVVGAFLRRIEA